MSNFLTRLFRRSKIDRTPRPAGGAPLSPPPNMYDLMDWSPRASTRSRAPVEVAAAPVSPSPVGVAAAPISDALATFRASVNGGSAGRRPGAPPTRPPSGAPPVPPPPPAPKPKEAQIRLLMGDGTVVQVAGDAELESRIAYLAANLFKPAPGATAEADPAPSESLPEYLEAEIKFLEADFEPSEMDAEASEMDAQTSEMDAEASEVDAQTSESEPEASERGVEPEILWPQVKLVFTDGSEAALPRDQEIVDRVAYVVKNLLPAPPAA